MKLIVKVRDLCLFYLLSFNLTSDTKFHFSHSLVDLTETIYSI